ncbi:PREDICTED: BRCA2-interacting transcriptional repressor EMSY [Drosophila arizonae]|uniref:BRCA2-interacting transcriptional repressor EMSY n=1 Tax=Drosophila arizonae TaxID=7263 RepID=A0ABM1NTE7_DROAR|nr:PREDICTED: BRCA2-interacting transcriptional repressor EMSY [Drosophila arizonae]
MRSMWPQTLEMSRDECRGMLRRLELESYSHVISVFRAQGSLSEPKAKLLEELRQLFHITQERHRAEVRRAANDEQLCTIAENVCGPNTWQEWSREGRRPYPLLPRISPQTALSIVANDLAAKAYAENSKLPPPNETGANLSETLREQSAYQTLKHGITKHQEPIVVMDEPFKVPDLPNEIKKATLKRKENESSDTKPNKKRNTQQDRQMAQLQQLPSQLSGGKDEDGQLVPLEQRPSARTLQQRYFYQQQQKHKQRLASKKGSGNPLANNSNASGVGINTKPAKSGRRRAQKQLQQQMQQQKQLQQQQELQQEQDQQPNHLVQPHVEYILDEALKSVAATKLKTIPAARVVYGPPEMLSPTTPRTFVNSPIVFKEKLSPTTQTIQPPQLSTPVKKYIVEERQQPGGTQPASANISTANLPLAPQIISVQQIAAPPKVRTTASGTILPAGTKLTPKKINLIDKQQLPSVPNTAVRLLPYEQQSAASPTTSVNNLGSSKAPATAAVQKYIVEERVPSQTVASVASTPLSSASAVNIIKNIPASSLNNTLITPLSSSSGAPVGPLFRKATATTTSTAATSVAAAGSSSGSVASTSQILGNIKLTSASGIKHVPSSALRNIKICSPNGKLFLQPAKLHTGSIIHKLNPSNVAAGGAGVTVSSAAVSPTGVGTPSSPQSSQQRITIQKMQLLTPTQVISSAAGGTSNVSVVSTSSMASSGTKVKPTTLTLGPAGVGKNNLVFLPTSGMRAVTLASSKPKPSGELLAAKPNVLVIGPSTSVNAANNSQATGTATGTGTGTGAGTGTAAAAAATSSALAKPKANQLITEDTPIDIINMPIIVADNGAPETKTSAKSAPMMVLNATDWEMELDQASKAAAATNATGTASSSATTTANDTKSNKQQLDDVIVEDAAGEDTENANSQIKDRTIEMHDDGDSAIEYVDMELEQPIEIECTSNISPETMTTTTSTTTSLKATIMPPLAEDEKKLDQPATGEQGTGPAAVTTTTILAKPSTLP